MNTLFFPAVLNWEVTPYCNHNCVHCYNHWRNDHDIHKDLSINKNLSSSSYLAIAKAIVDSKPVSVIITGGEPLAVFQKIKPAIQLLVENKINVSINTNATLITDEIITFLLSNNIPLFVSFPCANESICDQIVGYSGAYNKIIHSIQHLIDKGVNISVNMVVSKINIDYVRETAVFVKEHFGLDYFCATRAALPANAAAGFNEMLLSHSEFNFLLDLLVDIGQELNIRVDSAWAYSLCGFESEKAIETFAFKRSCGAGRFSFAISPLGNVKACAVDYEEYGNIVDAPFRHFIRKMQKWQNTSLIPTECKACPSLSLCGGGCRLDAKTACGDISKLDSTANIRNLHRSYVVPPKAIISAEKAFKFCSNAIFVEENNCIRVNVSSNYAYINTAFYEYSKNRAFYIHDLADEFGLSLDAATQYIVELYAQNIVVYAE